MTQITFQSHGAAVRAEKSEPKVPSNGGLVVIAYGSDGLTDHLSGPWATMIRDYAASLASQGFAVLIPDYLAVTATSPGPGVFDAIPRHRDTWQAAIADSVDYAAKLRGIARVGLLGFSLGGHLCLRVRSSVKVLAEFFAPTLDGIGAPGALAHAQIHHGKADALPGTAYAHAESIAATLRRESTPVELFGYEGAGHGFIGADPGNVAARARSKPRTLDFFRQNLK